MKSSTLYQFSQSPLLMNKSQPSTVGIVGPPLIFHHISFNFENQNCKVIAISGCSITPPPLTFLCHMFAQCAASQAECLGGDISYHKLSYYLSLPVLSLFSSERLPGQTPSLSQCNICLTLTQKISFIQHPTVVRVTSPSCDEVTEECWLVWTMIDNILRQWMTPTVRHAQWKVGLSQQLLLKKEISFIIWVPNCVFWIKFISFNPEQKNIKFQDFQGTEYIK